MSRRGGGDDGVRRPYGGALCVDASREPSRALASRAGVNVEHAYITLAMRALENKKNNQNL